VRKKAVFALSKLPHDRAIPALRALVESDRPRAIRREALFWLAQTNDDAVLPVFDELLAPNDDSR
jgi:HEAT repeat protein